MPLKIPARLSAALLMAGLVLPLMARPTPPATFILLGEVHDNAEQHRLRAERLRDMLSDGLSTTVVFEQIPAHRSPALAALRGEKPLDAEALVDIAQLDRKNWRWPLHKPLIEASLQGGAGIAGGNSAARSCVP